MSESQDEKPGLPFARIVRKHLGLSIADLAPAVTGKKESHWRKVESGKANCKMQIADRVARFLCSTVDELRNGPLTAERLKQISIDFKRHELEQLERSEKVEPEKGVA